MRPDRRSLLRLAVAGTVTSFAVPAARAEAAVPAVPAGPAVPLSPDFALNLLRRATYGPAPADVAEIRQLGATRWLERQLAPASIDDSVCDEALGARFSWLPKLPSELRATTPAAEDQSRILNELPAATVLRAVTSRRQLFEVMVEFWDQHLNVTCPHDSIWDSRGSYDRDVIRANALGRFRDMLLASAQAPAMLTYLNNATSRGSAPNENYGRELLELHTVGIDGGYTEEDVKNSARVLTGLTVDGKTGEFLYRPQWHATGPVRVLDWSSPNASAAEGLDVARAYLSYLAGHPSTARFLATKLARRFVADNPPQSLVDRLAATYLASDTAIVPVLRALFRSPEFAASVGGKTRRPYEDTVAAMRVTGAVPTTGSADVRSWRDLAWILGNAGQAPHAWPTPDGYPDVAAAWLSTSGALSRMQLHQGIVGGWWNHGIAYRPPAALLGGRTPRTAGEFVDLVALRLLQQHLAPAHRNALLGFLKLSERMPVPDWMLTYRTGALACLILDSPYWSMR